MRILIVKLGAIGDVIRTTSILEGLRGNEIDWLTSSAAKPVLLHNPFINKIFTWEERDQLRPYDLVISLEDDFEVCEFASLMFKKELKGAYVKDGKITYTPSQWFDMSAISKFGLEKANELKKLNKKTFQEHMAELLGTKVGEYVFELTEEENKNGGLVVRDLVAGDGKGRGKRKRIVGINTGAGGRWEMKALSVEKTIELVNRLQKDLGVMCLILGGEAEKERNEAVSMATGAPNAGVHSLRNFAAIINQCYVLVTSDSLAMHFGIALKKKIVAFFCPTSAAEIELYGLGAKVCPEMDCLTCYRKACDKEPNCMDKMEVEDLFSAV